MGLLLGSCLSIALAITCQNADKSIWERGAAAAGNVMLSGQSSRAEEKQVNAGTKGTEEERCRVTYLGHSSVLITMNGINILADPNFSHHIFFVIWRQNRIPMKIRDLPRLDLILISHGHYDHLDRRTIRRLPKDTPVIVPFGLKRALKFMGKEDIITLGKWKKHRVGDVTVTAVPAEHFMGRPPLFPITGYQGYVIEGDATVYFAGDTGMFDEFSEIGLRWDIDIALLPIGAYSPPSFRRHHMSPEDAIEAGRILRAKSVVPIHWGAFKLSLEPMREPLPRLKRAAIEAKCPSLLKILSPGQSISIRGEGDNKRIQIVPDTPSVGKP